MPSRTAVVIASLCFLGACATGPSVVSVPSPEPRASGTPPANDLERRQIEELPATGTRSNDRAPSSIERAAALNRVHLGPMIGHTTPTTARIWVKTADAGRISIKIGRRDDLADGRIVAGPLTNATTGFTGTVDIDGLTPETRYNYVVLVDRLPARRGQYDSFITPPPAGAANRFRFAFFSCVGTPVAARRGWNQVSRVEFDLVLQIGDNHYGNSTRPTDQRSHYAAQRASHGFRSVSARVPVLGIWDDHDFGRNNANGNMPGKEDSLATFKEFWANPSYGIPGDDGVYFKFSRGDVDFFMLDGRYHRSSRRVKKPGRKTMLGANQLAWLKRALAASRARVKFIASGTQWQSHGARDSWRGYKEERDELFRFIDDNRIEGVVLLSGDRHMTAGYRVLGRFLEISSGPLGSNNHRRRDSAERLFVYDEGQFFNVFDVDTRPEEPVIRLETHMVGHGMVARRTIPWTWVNGRSKSIGSVD